MFRTHAISEWDRAFLKQFTVHEGTLFDVIAASNYLGIKTLLNVVCKTIIHMIKGKSSEEIKQMFNLSDSRDEIAKKSTTNDNAVTSSRADSKKK